MSALYFWGEEISLVSSTSDMNQAASWNNFNKSTNLIEKTFYFVYYWVYTIFTSFHYILQLPEFNI